jgi:hypothetical protein
MRRSSSTVSITIVAMLSITAKGLAADGYPRAPELAAAQAEIDVLRAIGRRSHVDAEAQRS